MSAVAAAPAVSDRDLELARALLVMAAERSALCARLHEAVEWGSFSGQMAEGYLTAVDEFEVRCAALRRRHYARSRARLVVCVTSASLATPTGRGSRTVWQTSSDGWAVTQALAWAYSTGWRDLASVPVRVDTARQCLVSDVGPLMAAWLCEVDPFPVGTRVRWRDTWTYPERDVAATVIGRAQSYAAGDHDWYLHTDDGEDACASWQDLAPEGWGSGRSGRVSA